LEFADALIAELAYMASRITSPSEVSSVFIGGGTPSLMSGSIVGRVLHAIARYWHMTDDIEITIEANPSSVEVSRFRDYRAAGITRISIGIQSLDELALKVLGRTHTVEEAIRGFSIARSLFERVSLDLIYGRPGQTLNGWQAELRYALDLEPDHISSYQLSVEPGTRYAYLCASGKLVMPTDDLELAMFELTRSMLGKRGLLAYEVSNYARPGYECRHNINYWRCGEYIGVGPGAHGRITYNNRRYATETEALPEKWLELVKRHGNGLVVNDILSMKEQAYELVLMGMRLSEGVDLRRYKNLVGRHINRAGLALLEEEKLVKVTKNRRVRPTEAGYAVLNFVIDKLLD